MNTRPADEKLREAFQARGASQGSECSEEDLDRIWRAVSGELAPAERRDVVDRMAASPACAEAWRIAHELWRAAQGDAEDVVEKPSRGWSPTWLAAAAVLVLAAGAGLFVRFNAPPASEFRDPAAIVVESLAGADTALPRDAFRLRWTPGPPGARYDVRVTTEDLQILATATGLTEPEFVVDADRLSPVAAGARVLWQVDLALPDGEKISSRTFVLRVN